MTLESLLYPAALYQGKPRFQKLEGGAQAFTVGGSDVAFRTNKGSGDLSGFMVRISGQTDIATADLVLLPRAPHGLFSRVRFQPEGRVPLIDNVNSYSLFVHDWYTRGVSPFVFGARDIRPGGLQANTTSRSALIESFPLAVGANQAFELWVWISAQRSPLDPRGRIPLDNQHEHRLIFTPATEAQLVTVPGNWAQDSMQVEVWQVTYDAPPRSAAIKQPDRKWAILIEEIEDVAAVGHNYIDLTPDGSLILGIGVTLALNDLVASSDDITSISMKIDKTYLVEPATDPRALFFWMKRMTGFAPPVDGLLYFGFDDYADTDTRLHEALITTEDAADAKVVASKLQPSLGRPLNTKDANAIQIDVEIPSGTTLGTTPRLYTTIRKLIAVG